MMVRTDACEGKALSPGTTRATTCAAEFSARKRGNIKEYAAASTRALNERAKPAKESKNVPNGFFAAAASCRCVPCKNAALKVLGRSENLEKPTSTIAQVPTIKSIATV